MRKGFDIAGWAQEVARKKPQMDALAVTLVNYGARVTPDEDSRDVAALHYRVAFLFSDAVMVTIGIILMDHQTDFDVVVETMTTLPVERKGQGFGSQAVAKLLAWAKEKGLSVAATQVAGDASERFWKQNGFVRCPEPNLTGNYVWQGRMD